MFSLIQAIPSAGQFLFKQSVWYLSPASYSRVLIFFLWAIYRQLTEENTKANFFLFFYTFGVCHVVLCFFYASLFLLFMCIIRPLIFFLFFTTKFSNLFVVFPFRGLYDIFVLFGPCAGNSCLSPNHPLILPLFQPGMLALFLAICVTSGHFLWLLPSNEDEGRWEACVFSELHMNTIPGGQLTVAQ